MPKIFCFHSIKGGTGKTTLAIIAANELIKAGKKCLLIDTDMANHSLSFYYSYGLNIDHKTIRNKNIFKVFIEESLNENILTIDNNTGLIYADVRLSDFRGIATIKRLKKTLLATNAPLIWDYILIDTSPTFDNITANILYASDVLIIPVVPDVFNFQSLKYLISKIKELELTELDINIIFNQYIKSRSSNKENFNNQIMDLFYKDKELKPFIVPQAISKLTAIRQYLSDREYNITKAKKSYQEIRELLQWLKLS